jgi:undecaprenyl-diphosphatase
VWCWYRGHRADAVLVVGAMAGASVVFRGLKVLLDRPRPPAATQLVRETNESLPSGHATMSVVVIGAIVVLAWAGRSVTARVAMTAAAAAWIGAVGATRINRGVHRFSDVLAGWLVGATWLALCVAAGSRWTARVAARR